MLIDTRNVRPSSTTASNSSVSQKRSANLLKHWSGKVSWRSHHPPKVNDWTSNASKAIGSPGLTTPQLTTASLRVSGFQDKGAIWRGEELYYFSIPTGIRHQAHADHPNMFRVVYPDGTLSGDCYNLARTQQHCRDLARAIYPRQSAATSALSENNVAGAPGKAVHSSFGPGRHSPTPPSLRKPSPSEASS